MIFLSGCRVPCLFVFTFLANEACSQESTNPVASTIQTQQIISDSTAPRKELRFFLNLQGRWILKDADAASKASGHLEFSPVSLGYFVNADLDFGGGNLGFVVHGVYGFDPLDNHFTATWYTSFNSVAFTGTAKPSEKQLEFLISHPMLEPATKDPGSKLKLLYRIALIDSNQLRLQLVKVDLDNKEAVQMDVVATRADDDSPAQATD